MIEEEIWYKDEERKPRIDVHDELLGLSPAKPYNNTRMECEKYLRDNIEGYPWNTVSAMTTDVVFATINFLMNKIDDLEQKIKRE